MLAIELAISNLLMLLILYAREYVPLCLWNIWGRNGGWAPTHVLRWSTTQLSWPLALRCSKAHQPASPNPQRMASSKQRGKARHHPTPMCISWPHWAAGYQLGKTEQECSVRAGRPDSGAQTCPPVVETQLASYQLCGFVKAYPFWASVSQISNWG